MAGGFTRIRSSAKFNLSHQLNSLWHKFDVIELTENHRQGEDKVYADMLNRIRFGEQTDRDLEQLKTRVTENLPTDATFLFGKNRLVSSHNLSMLHSLSGQEKQFNATIIHR